MATEIIIAITGAVTSALSACVSWALAKKKYNAEVDSTIIENMQKSLEFYKSQSDYNTKVLGDLQDENRELRKQVTQLQAQVLTLMGSICYDATCTIRKLQQEVETGGGRKKRKSDGDKDQKDIQGA